MDARWRIKEFAARTGIPEVTLRAWERRYGVLQPVRTEGGYRLYSPADEQRVLAMQAHIARGVAPAQAARLALAEDAPAGDLPSDPAQLVEALLAAIGAYDATRADRLLEAAFFLDRTEALRDVVVPLLHEIGARWARGELTVAHEHFASHLVERRLLRLAEGWGEGAGPLALLACPPGERHALGLLCFGVAAAGQGWRVAYLGADMPLEQVADTAATLAPDAVVLSAVVAERFEENAALLAELGAQHRLLVGGAGASAKIARRARAERLDGDPVTAAAALRART